MAVKTLETSLTAVGTSSPFAVPALANPRLSGMVIVVSGAPVYTVQYSLNGVDYLPLATDLTSQSTSADFTVVFPVKDIRLSFDSGSGEVKLVTRADFGGFS